MRKSDFPAIPFDCAPSHLSVLRALLKRGGSSGSGPAQRLRRIRLRKSAPARILLYSLLVAANNAWLRALPELGIIVQ